MSSRFLSELPSCNVLCGSTCTVIFDIEHVFVLLHLKLIPVFEYLQATKTSRLKVDQLHRPVCYDRKLHYFQNYSFPGCQVECLIGNLLQECGCIGVNTLGELPKDKICSPSEALACFQKLAFRFSAMLTKCRVQNCSEACTYWNYKVSLSAGQVFNPVNQDEMMAHWRLPKGDPKGRFTTKRFQSHLFRSGDTVKVHR